MSTDPDANQGDQDSARGVILGLGLPLGFVLISLLLDAIDDKTQLAPVHDSVNAAVLFCTVSFALTGAGFAVRTWRVLSWERLLAAVFGCALAFSMGGFLLLMHATNLWFAWRDFPAAKTRTFTMNFPISRAYATHGKGDHFHIQTMYMWSDMGIEEHDFRFMQNHRRPDDPGKNPDEIKSDGYFCARVQMQQADKALRILNAGNTTLRWNTVVTCPQLMPPMEVPSQP